MRRLLRFLILAAGATSAAAACSDEMTTAATTSASGSGGTSAGGEAGNGGIAATGGTGGTPSGSGGAGGAFSGENRVFVTSAKYTGALGGLTGGDAQCQALADAASLGGSWMAWLGDGTDGPATRFLQSTTPYKLVTGDVIAQDWPDLIDGTIAIPINHDETGTPLPAADDMIVWTAVFHTGGNPTPVHCAGWTDDSDALVPTGLASATDTGWTVFAPHNCSEMHRLYCFEQ